MKKSEQDDAVETKVRKRMRKRDAKAARHDHESAPTQESRFSLEIPGLSIIKNSIITPLMLASERVVEYILPEDRMREEEEKLNQADTHQVIEQKMDRLTLDEETHKTRICKKRLRRQVTPDRHMPMSDNLMDRAKDCIDFISSKKREKVEVADGFATNLIELSEGAVQKLSGEKGEDAYNLRFIKPSKKFYNLLMSVWMQLESQ